MRYVQVSQVRDLVYGAMFTRGVDDLQHTAIFVGGSDVSAGEAGAGAGVAHVLRADAGLGDARLQRGQHHGGRGRGDGRQARAALPGSRSRGAGRHRARRLARGATAGAGGRPSESGFADAGPRRGRLPGCLRQSSRRKIRRPSKACPRLTRGRWSKEPRSSSRCLRPGVELLSAAVRANAKSLQVAIDLSAVPPVGLAGIEVTDKAKSRDGMICYGAIGVGGTKMKIHKAAIGKLFEANDQVLDAEEIYRIGQQLGAQHARSAPGNARAGCPRGVRRTPTTPSWAWAARF